MRALRTWQKTVMRRLCSDGLSICLGSILLAGLLAVLAGCATRETVLTEPPAESLPPEPTGPTVTPLSDGRVGFVIREVPNRPEDWQDDFSAAVACLEGEDYAGAVELLQRVIAQEPGVSAPYIDIALAYRELGEPEPAEQNLKEALELFPSHPVAGNAYGLLLRSDGRFAEAQTVYRQVLERFPDYAPAHRNLGILCDLYLNDLECAVRHYALYQAVNPADQQVDLWLVDLRQRLGQ